MCTEVAGFRAGRASRNLGHEAAGVVVEAGPRSGVVPGTRVVVMPQDSCGVCSLCLAGEHIHCRTPRNALAVCNSPTGRATYAQYCIQQDRLLVPLPDDISIEHGSMACCGLGPTFNACRLLRVTADDTVIVAGLGPVGLGGVINATHLGARVIGLDVNPYRLALARELGAEAVFDPTAEGAAEAILAQTDGLGVDKAIETANVEASPPFLARLVRPKGGIALVSWAGSLSVRDIVGRGLAVVGAWHWNHLVHGRQMLEVIRRNAAKLDRLITHRFPMSEVRKAFELQCTGQCGKVLLDPWA
ncbi:MAG: zinc-binding dehydrogenase [Lentisphaeria bacterium]|nr:zinc-binding dehydrogenase [Lentisphaeria bacterium]